MSAREVDTPAPFHVKRSANGDIVGDGHGPTTRLQHGLTMQGFATFSERELDPEIQAWRLSLYQESQAGRVEDDKSVLAYAAKRQDAIAIKHKGETYNEDIHDALAIEVRACGCTPMEAAESILAASKRDVIDIEDDRVQIRESLK